MSRAFCLSQARAGGVLSAPDMDQAALMLDLGGGTGGEEGPPTGEVPMPKPEEGSYLRLIDVCITQL